MANPMEQPGLFFVIATLLDGCWAVLAGRVRNVLAVRGRLRAPEAHWRRR